MANYYFFLRKTTKKVLVSATMEFAASHRKQAKTKNREWPTKLTWSADIFCSSRICLSFPYCSDYGKWAILASSA